MSNGECGSLIQPFAITLHTSLRKPPSIGTLLFRISPRDSPFLALAYKVDSPASIHSNATRHRFPSEILNDRRSIRDQVTEETYLSGPQTIPESVTHTPPSITPRAWYVCRCCDNGVTCQFALLLFVEESIAYVDGDRTDAAARRGGSARPFVGKANANKIK